MGGGINQKMVAGEGDGGTHGRRHICCTCECTGMVWPCYGKGDLEQFADAGCDGMVVRTSDKIRTKQQKMGK